MRESKHGKKKSESKSKLSTPAKALLITAIIVAAVIIGFFLWVVYGNDSSKGVKESESTGTQQEETKKTAVFNVADNWSVPADAFKGSNGNGSFDQEKVINKADLEMLYSEMGVDQEATTGSDKKRVDAVERFMEGIYYEADPDSNLSNGDIVTVTIRSKEDVAEIEDEAGITINGVEESKEVTVSGLAEKFSIGELSQQTDLLQTAKDTAERKIRESTANHKQDIFANEAEYDATLEFYGIYLAKPQDPAADDALIVLYRLTSKYPDSNYSRWTQEGDYVYTYEMTHFDDIDKDTTTEDIEKGLKYDSFRYENQAYEVLQWYRENLDPSTPYTINQISFR